jgi:NTE family protein
MSMSIPLFMRPVEHDGRLWVDGGTVWNYPLTVFDTTGDSPSTVGFMLASTPPAPTPASQLRSFRGRAEHLVETLLATQVDDWAHRPDDQARTVRIECGNVRSTAWALTDQERQFLTDAGASATRAFLAARHTG